jgi:siroheme synthase (precorrin-2 oxidase/ferrochelatase)
MRMDTHKPTGKRERMNTSGTPGGSRYIRRDAQGHFTSDQSEVGRSLAADRRQHAKHTAPRGQKDRGD